MGHSVVGLFSTSGPQNRRVIMMVIMAGVLGGGRAAGWEAG
jgi:hypothetical protein